MKKLKNLLSALVLVAILGACGKQAPAKNKDEPIRTADLLENIVRQDDIGKNIEADEISVEDSNKKATNSKKVDDEQRIETMTLKAKRKK